MLGTQSSYTVETLLPGDAGTQQTIEKIRGIVNEAWRSLDVRRFAINILRNAGAPQYDDWAKVVAIYQWIQNNFYFVLDPVTKEVLMPFPDLVELGAGDCDEINATAMAVLLGVIGYEPRLVTVAANPDDPDTFSHVYTEVMVNGNWIPVDAARPGAQIGVAPPSYYRRMWWSLVDDASGDYSGAGQMTSGRRSLAGLNGYGGIDWNSLLNTGVQITPQLISASQGQPINSALRTPIGPGGYSSVVPQSGVVGNSAQSQNQTLLLLLLGAGLLWALMN